MSPIDKLEVYPSTSAAKAAVRRRKRPRQETPDTSRKYAPSPTRKNSGCRNKPRQAAKNRYPFEVTDIADNSLRYPANHAVLIERICHHHQYGKPEHGVPGRFSSIIFFHDMMLLISSTISPINAESVAGIEKKISPTVHSKISRTKSNARIFLPATSVPFCAALPGQSMVSPASSSTAADKSRKSPAAAGSVRQSPERWPRQTTSSGDLYSRLLASSATSGLPAIAVKTWCRRWHRSVKRKSLKGAGFSRRRARF